MGQCQGTTKKGDRCRRPAREDSAFCSIHLDEEIRPRSPKSEVWDSDSIMKAAIGFGLVAAIFLYRFKR